MTTLIKRNGTNGAKLVAVIFAEPAVDHYNADLFRCILGACYKQHTYYSINISCSVEYVVR